MRNLCLLLLILASWACEFDTQKDELNSGTAPVKTQLNQTIKPIQNLSSNQKRTAQRICENLRSQRLRLKSLPNGTEQYFRTREKTCPNGQTIRKQVRAELQLEALGPYWQTSQSVNLHSPILTDRSSIFDELCDDLNAGLEVENTQLISSRQLQFRFQEFPNDDLDTVQIITYKMDRGSWRAKKIDEYDIDRGLDTPNDQGQTSAQRHLYFCRNSQTSGELWQKPF